MLDILFWIAVGAVVAWHIPMPPWARWAINAVRAKLGKGPIGQ